MSWKGAFLYDRPSEVIATRHRIRQCPLVLRLPVCLVDVDSDPERFAVAAIADAADRRGTEVVETHRHTHVAFRGADAIGRIEANPSQMLHIGFRPGVTGVLCGHAVSAIEMAADIARRNAELARCRDENMGEILAHAAT